MRRRFCYVCLDCHPNPPATDTDSQRINRKTYISVEDNESTTKNMYLYRLSQKDVYMHSTN